ncbi:MAG: kynureninase [Mariniblastus sp.]|nr:kynureninase [Mariniblastus sp.]
MKNETRQPTSQRLEQEARQLDAADPIAHFRNEFYFPETEDGRQEIYLVGNSLGLQPKITRDFVLQELDAWQSRGVRGHFEGDFPWMPYHEFLSETMAGLVGAQPEEVVVMNTLTVNLHLMMATFYRPQGKRNKILIERQAFPSDYYAVESQARWHGLDPAECMVQVEPDEGQNTLSTEKICQAIHSHRETLAMILLPGVQYYTGQVLDMQAITQTAHEFDIPVGFDLAHAAGNIPLQLSDWDVDFACWCTYKYLNSGPGSIGGCFVNSRHSGNPDCFRLAGWWGDDKATRFRMENQFRAIPTAEGWQLSNPPILSAAAVRASLDIFQRVGGMAPLREKSLQLTRFFRDCLEQRLPGQVEILTPAEPAGHGCQLSLQVDLRDIPGKAVFEQLESAGARTDWREPDVIRAAPVPLYNSFQDVFRFVGELARIVDGP